MELSSSWRVQSRSANQEKYTDSAHDESALLNHKNPLVVSPQSCVFCCWDSEIKKGSLRWACRYDVGHKLIQNLVGETIRNVLILHIEGMRQITLTLRLLMSYIYIWSAYS